MANGTDIAPIADTCFTVPFEPNPRFTGRDPILADLGGGYSWANRLPQPPS